MTQYWVIIPAAGVGKRMQSAIPKQYLTLNQQTILDVTIARFLTHPSILGVAVGVSCDDEYWPLSEWATHPQVIRYDGGKQRADTVLNGLQVLQAVGIDGHTDVLVHDAARPLISHSAITRIVEHKGEFGALLAVPSKDTLKLANDSSCSQGTVDRSVIWQAQTPQKFPLGALLEGLSTAMEEGLEITDESSAMEQLGWQPTLVEGESTNFKITVPSDLLVAEALLASKAFKGQQESE
ncbi:2-C-methyl-D-erythritol 4-phosphate cytidylyltransferase [Marinomonas piezotolerans]|uniref:2-C-methyl-D-erythritol 4-phosphate cytidylyltransferase n=1 Tax=Marinomonas piezotolerans TaxID=2213058 RepID=A0A370U4G8_9GAMM|nr:2-C-methyl-D-erythritol 4-phosphate cytidylyltransferase [Marinomonas piezotolerans]RDL42675.1 2-C-methyl-D-erythritol 4-phosphate cytidylyltransferase [Marinomonas piezotolerans]